MTASDGSFHATGLPANVQLEGSQQSTVSDPGRPTLTAFHTDFAPVSIPLPPNGDKTPIVFKFDPSGTIDVRVSRLGKPVTMASVSASRASGLLPRCIGLPDKTVSDDGSARFTGIPVGQKHVYIQVRSNPTAPVGINRIVEVVAGEVTPVNIELGGELASLQGTVLIDGTPAVNAQVTFTTSDETDPVSVSPNRISEDGTWSMDEVPADAGTFLISTTVDDLSVERSIPVELKPGDSAAIHIDHGGIGDAAEESATLRGSVRIEGKWPEHASVAFEMDKAETHFVFRNRIPLRPYEEKSDGTIGPAGSPSVPDESLPWSLEGVAAGTGTLKVEANDPDGGSYVRFIELSLTPDEEQELEIILTDDDLAVEQNQP